MPSIGAKAEDSLNYLDAAMLYPSYATLIAFNGILCWHVYTYAGDISAHGEMLSVTGGGMEIHLRCIEERTDTI
ncbi:MAG: hypothetical protein LBB19_00845 [Puniceicoccales bacterium]|jgi:hypothetical protein|nr:hypothetical protein [Puniceicoccales bacterium]